VGYEFARRGRAKEAERALEEACLARFGMRRPTGATPRDPLRQWLIYQSRRFRAACRDDRLRQECITPYTPEQNGMIERFFRSLKEECVWQHLFPSFAAARREIARGSAGTMRRARTRRWAIGARANTGRNQVSWGLHFGGALHASAPAPVGANPVE
jgi:putative transposase